MAVGLVVIVAGGFVGKSRRDRYRQPAQPGGRYATHHGKEARRSRGAAATEVPSGRPTQVGRKASKPVTLSWRINRRCSALNSLSSTR